MDWPFEFYKCRPHSFLPYISDILKHCHGQVCWWMKNEWIRYWRRCKSGNLAEFWNGDFQKIRCVHVYVCKCIYISVISCNTFWFCPMSFNVHPVAVVNSLTAPDLLTIHTTIAAPSRDPWVHFMLFMSCDSMWVAALRMHISLPHSLLIKSNKTISLIYSSITILTPFKHKPFFPLCSQFAMSFQHFNFDKLLMEMTLEFVGKRIMDVCSNGAAPLN